MPTGLDVIIVDDDQSVCATLAGLIKEFYAWGDVVSFTDPDEATRYCLNRDVGVGIFVVDIFLGQEDGFYFLDSIEEKFPTAYEDTIMITGNASDTVVNMCVASDVNYLLEKPVRPYALQLAVRAIAMKYVKFAKKILDDRAFADRLQRYEM